MIFGPADEPMPEVDLSELRLNQMLGDIKRNSRNRRIALIAPVVLVAAVVGAMIAAPPQHGGLALVADAEANDPQLPRVFGSNGVWRLAEPIEEAPLTNAGPAAVIEAPTDPAAPDFVLSPPDQDDLNSLPTSTSTPPTSTSGQSLTTGAALSPDVAAAPAIPDDPAPLDWSSYRATIRVEAATEQPAEAPVEAPPTIEPATIEPLDAQPVETSADPAATATEVLEPETPELETLETEISSEEASLTPEDNQAPDDVTVAALPQNESDPAEANPSTPPAESTDAETQAFSTPATIIPQSVLVYSAHVSVTVQVVDDDSSVIDWCNTRVDWGDGSVTRVAGADDAALCAASCEYEATSSATSESVTSGTAASGIETGGTDTSGAETGIAETMEFEHDYADTIDASPRIFVATGDGCSYTLAELQLPPFTVVPLP